MDSNTQFRTLAELARSLAEISGDVGMLTSEASATINTTSLVGAANARDNMNQMVGTLMGVVDQVTTMQKLLDTIFALHRTTIVD